MHNHFQWNVSQQTFCCRHNTTLDRLILQPSGWKKRCRQKVKDISMKTQRKWKASKHCCAQSEWLGHSQFLMITCPKRTHCCNFVKFSFKAALCCHSLVVCFVKCNATHRNHCFMPFWSGLIKQHQSCIVHESQKKSHCMVQQQSLTTLMHQRMHQHQQWMNDNDNDPIKNNLTKNGCVLCQKHQPAWRLRGDELLLLTDLKDLIDALVQLCAAAGHQWAFQQWPCSLC